MIGRAAQDCEQNVCLLIKEDAVVANARLVQQSGEFGPDRIVPTPVFGSLAREQLHLEGKLFHVPYAFLLAFPPRRSTGTVIVTRRSAPTTMVMMMPGTLARPRP